MSRPVPPRIIAFLQLDIEYGRGILQGIARYFQQHPEITVLKFMRPAAYRREAIVRLAPDGIIAQISNQEDERVLSQLGVPIVNVSGILRHPALTTVNSDDMGVGQLALSHFHGRNLRHFAYVGDRTHAAAKLRWQGFQAAARRLGTPTVPRYFLPHEESDSPYPERLQRGLVKWLRQLPHPIGVLCFTDRVAIEVAEACARARLRVPEQVAILGTGNDASRLDFAHVEVSSIQLNTTRIGHLAAETLHQMIQQPGQPPVEILVPPQRISIRRSTDRFAVNDELVAGALDHISAHVGNPVYVTEIARAAGVSRRSLEMHFRRSLGTSVYAQVQRIRFERVLELMTDPAMSLDAIAYSTGFGGAAAFSTMFRRHFKVAPSVYRQGILPQPPHFPAPGPAAPRNRHARR
ncbi:MAG: substrate-binding domain-containing protein [Opitutae bacterium]